MVPTTKKSASDLAREHRWKRQRELEDAQLRALTEMASYRLDELFDALGVGDLRLRGKMYSGCCPVHGGDNTTSFNLYPDGHTARGNWKCRTRSCQRTFKASLLGFVRGVLSHRNGWTPDDKDDSNIVPFKQAIWLVCEVLGTKLRDIRVDQATAERKKFVSEMAALGKTPELLAEGWTREQVRGRLVVPSPYYLARGYSAEVLDRYDVGEPRVDKPGQFFNRVVVPVFDRAGRRVVGVTARTKFPECEECRRFHAPGLPCPQSFEERRDPRVTKWRHTDGLQVEQSLYNLWFAAEHIRHTGVVVLVEGPGDVWRLEEAGVRNSVALFGMTMSDAQQVLLESSGALTVILLLDRDGAGRRGVEEIQERLGRMFRIAIPEFETKDLGEMPVGRVIANVSPILDRYALKRK